MAYNASQFEKEILAFWKKTNAFQQSIDLRSPEKRYSFYDGPPFATGLPHYGHLVASLMKDIVPRYWTMKGYRVERKWGWDCHGLPVENIVEKEMNLPGRKEIVDLGVDVFNEACRSSVLKYTNEWKETIERFGRWVDMENDYKTMDRPFMESVWWVFKQLFDRGLVYEGKKPMHICPRCVTPLSNFEVTQGYKDIKDLSVTAQFNITNAKEKLGFDGDVYALAWTTTPWTLPGNVLLAVGEDVEYGVYEHAETGDKYILAIALLDDVVATREDKSAFVLVTEIKGSELAGLTYEPLFPYFKEEAKAFYIATADFVTTESGTGIVHIAPAFGADDYDLCQKLDAPFIQHVSMDGTFIPEVTDFAGQHVKPIEDHMATDIEIVKWLAHNGRLFAKKKYEHSYPHCWRCDTPLLNYATSSWFISVTSLKEDLVRINKEQTHWVPDHIKEKRFGQWLEGARDWAVSRNRFWGAPIPIWRAEDGALLCVGSAQELEELTGKSVPDLHKHFVDDLVIEKDGKTYTRVPEVLDCWFESGAMPYGQAHYPFEHKEQFENTFPAQFIAEGQDQTRGWFYTLHVLAVALTTGENPAIPVSKGVPAFSNVIVNGIVLAEDGKKMSKRLKNYPDPTEILEKYGADALRFYLANSPVMHAENLNFSEDGVREIFNKVINTTANMLAFYEMFAEKNSVDETLVSENILDIWITARLAETKERVSSSIESYKLAEATRPILDCIQDFSQWYVRRSRDRVKGEDEADARASIATLHSSLKELAIVLAPFTPFLSERMYQALKEYSVQKESYKESVHHEDWSDANNSDNHVLQHMKALRSAIELGLSLRKEAGLKVRQPLQSVGLVNSSFGEEYVALLLDELNVKYVEIGKQFEVSKEENGCIVSLDTTLTKELVEEGKIRELIRTINDARKQQGLTRDHLATMHFSADEHLLAIVKTYQDEVMRATRLASLEFVDEEQPQTLEDHTFGFRLK